MKRTCTSLVLLAFLFIPSAFGVQEEDVKKTFTVQPGGKLVLDLNAEAVQVTTEKTTTVTVVAEYIPERYKKNLTIEQSGNEIRVRFRPARDRQTDARFSITIPVEFNVEADYAGGRFEIGEELNGTLNVETGGGSVDVGTILGESTISSGGGSIDVRALESNATVTTGGGNVEIKKIGGSAKLKTGGGSFDVGKVGKDLQLQTGGGNVRVDEVGGEADVTSGGGNVRVGPVAKSGKYKTGGGNLEVSGGLGRTKVETGGGSVTLDKLTGSVDVHTGGGSVTTQLTPSGTEESRMYSKGGDLTLYLPADAKVTVEATLNVRRSGRREYRIRSDFKLEDVKEDEDGNKSATVKLNGGGTLITMETTDGDIEIRRMR